MIGQQVGGKTPLGYEVKDDKVVVVEKDAVCVHMKLPAKLSPPDLIETHVGRVEVLSQNLIVVLRKPDAG
jgi:site-specific DNA recombinase